MTPDSKSSVGSFIKRKRSGNDVAEAIRDFSSTAMRSELAKQRLFYMEKEDNRRENEEQCRKHQLLFEEWEKCISSQSIASRSS